MGSLHVYLQRLLSQTFTGWGPPVSPGPSKGTGPRERSNNVCLLHSTRIDVQGTTLSRRLAWTPKSGVGFRDRPCGVGVAGELGRTRPLLQRDVMLASRCGPKSKATLGPAVKNVFVPRWLKLKTVVPQKREAAQ